LQKIVGSPKPMIFFVFKGGRGKQHGPLFYFQKGVVMILQQFPSEDDFNRMAKDFNVIPLCVEILADTETPVSLLQKCLDQQGPVFLFESVEGGERWGRYSFLGFSTQAHISVFTDRVEIQDDQGSQSFAHNGNPLNILKQIMNGYRPANYSGLPRFWGGLVGYFSYEMVSFFEKIPNRLPENTPIAQFMIPDQLMVFDNIRHTLLAIAISFLNPDSTPSDHYRKAVETLQSIVQLVKSRMPGVPQPISRPASPLQPSCPDETYRRQVQQVKSHIQAGDIIQAVLSQKFVCNSPPDIWMLYRAQRFINPSPYLFFLRMDGQALIGSSPETMVRLENGIATLRPIAGTRPRGNTEQQDRALANELLQDEKERAEHLMLVDLGRNDLGRVAETGSVQVTDLMVVERYSHVMHLVSNITCDLKPELDAWDLLRATFPAGTLSGAPKVRAMEIIDELEQEPRGPYGGAVGYISFSGNMDLAITIRTACIANGKLTVRAGAGIVADSDPERERIETVNKAKAIEKALLLIG
jgi:anthranilate synthase component 1